MARPTAPASLSKPTMDTRFHIDYDWWEQSGKDVYVHIQEMCSEYGGEDLEGLSREEMVDWIDPNTAIVRRVDRFTYTFLNHCSLNDDFITERTTLIDSVFRALLAAANRPMKPAELAERIDRPADTILKTLAGRRIYKGIRPFEEDKR